MYTYNGLSIEVNGSKFWILTLSTEYTRIIQLFMFFASVFLFDADLVNKPFAL